MSILIFIDVYKLSDSIIINKMNREEKKKYYRSIIIDKYKELLLDKGYDRATIAELSRETGLAQGTIFNHFSTKGDLLTTIYNQYFFLGASTYLEKNSCFNSPYRCVRGYIESYLIKSLEFPKDCLKALYSLSYETGKKNTYEVVEALDRMFIYEFNKILNYGYKKKQSDQDFFIEILYSFIFTRFSSYSVNDEDKASFSEKLLKDIDKLLKLSGFI